MVNYTIWWLSIYSRLTQYNHRVVPLICMAAVVQRDMQHTIRPLINNSLSQNLRSSRLDAGCSWQLDPIHFSWMPVSSPEDVVQCHPRLREMHTLVVQQLGAKKLRHYVFLKLRTSSSTQQNSGVVAGLCKHGLSQLDHSNLGSNWHERPLGQSLTLRWCYSLRVAPLGNNAILWLAIGLWGIHAS